jgi:hypothetical protein
MAGNTKPIQVSLRGDDPSVMADWAGGCWDHRARAGAVDVDTSEEDPGLNSG